MPDGGEGLEAASVLTTLGLARELPHLVDTLSRHDLETCISMMNDIGRPKFITHLKALGIQRLRDRQMIANAVSKAGRGGVVLRPGDPQLFFTPWNWAITDDGLGVTNTPGASLKVQWTTRRVLDEESAVELTFDTSAVSVPFMTLALSLDGNAPVTMQLQPGESHATVRLPIPPSSLQLHFGEMDLVMEPSPSRAQEHTLTLTVLNSKQAMDRWAAPPPPKRGGLGRLRRYASAPANLDALESLEPPMISSSGSVGDNLGDLHDCRLPACSLRLRSLTLPPGAVAARPATRPKRLLAFGDSVTEGVGAAFEPGCKGDLVANTSTATWCSVLADRLDAELSAVGFGRLAWTVDGNGNVPRFIDLEQREAGSSWDQLWMGQPRTFDAGALPDYVFVNLGTNDGLLTKLAGDASEVRRAVLTWLTDVRARLGPVPQIVLCVPFGGFGGALQPPYNVLSSAFEQYQTQQRALHGTSANEPGDKRAHLVDLGEAATVHLTGFRFNKEGSFDSTRESADGIHPTVARHAELGEMLYQAVAPLLARADAAGIAAKLDTSVANYVATVDAEMKPIGSLLLSTVRSTEGHWDLDEWNDSSSSSYGSSSVPALSEDGEADSPSSDSQQLLVD